MKSKIPTTSVINPKPKIFEWTLKHQEAFDAVKEAHSTAPGLGYPDFSKEFIQ